MSRALAFAAALLFVGIVVDSARAESLFVYAQGQVNGVIRTWHNPVASIGEVSLADHGLVEHLSWSVISPRDAASGLPTGKRQHRPLVLGVRMSMATLLIGQALTNNENLTTVKVLFFAADPDTGVQSLRRTWTLTNANVSSLAVYTVREEDELVSYVDMQFTYQKVGIEDHESGFSYLDDWESPVSAPQLP